MSSLRGAPSQLNSAAGAFLPQPHFLVLHNLTNRPISPRAYVVDVKIHLPKHLPIELKSWHLKIRLGYDLRR